MDLRKTASQLAKGEIKSVVKDVKVKIERSLNLAGLVIISLAAMIGSGLFVLPSFTADIMGPGIWMAFLLAGIVVIPGAISKSELGSAMPSSGGSYVYLERTFGPLIGTISGLGLWASFLLKSAFALIGFTAYLYAVTTYFDTTVDTLLVSMVALLVITILNIYGIKKIKKVQSPILIVTVAVLILICIVQLFDSSTDFSVPYNGAIDVVKNDPLLLGEAAALVIIAYSGIIKVGAIGGEVKDPEKNLPSGIIISLSAAILLYCFVTFVMMASVPGEWWLNDGGEPREDSVFAFVDAVAGTRIGIFMAILAILTMISGALAGVLASSRFLFAMSRDNLLPQALEDVNARFETPHWAIIITSLTMAACIILLPVKDVAKLASGFQIMVFVLINISVIVLRRANFAHGWYHPKYKSPLYPWLQIFGVISGTYLVYLMGQKAILGAFAAFIIGAVTYYSYGVKHSHIRTTPFDTFMKMLSESDPTQRTIREAAFHAADLGGKNHLTLREFIAALKALHFTFTNDEYRDIFHHVDKEANGYIDIDQFLASIHIAEEE